MELPIYDTVIQKFLRQTLIEQNFIYIDLWSFIHFSSGLILGLLFKKYYTKKHSWIIALIILVAYEYFEIFLTDILFIAEKPLDTIWDIIIGMIGFYITYPLNINKEKI